MVPLRLACGKALVEQVHDEAQYDHDEYTEELVHPHGYAVEAFDAAAVDRLVVANDALITLAALVAELALVVFEAWLLAAKYWTGNESVGKLHALVGTVIVLDCIQL